MGLLLRERNKQASVQFFGWTEKLDRNLFVEKSIQMQKADTVYNGINPRPNSAIQSILRTKLNRSKYIADVVFRTAEQASFIWRILFNQAP